MYVNNYFEIKIFYLEVYLYMKFKSYIVIQNELKTLNVKKI